MQRLTNGTLVGLGFPSKASSDAVDVKSSAELLARPVHATIALLLYTIVLLALEFGPGFVLRTS
ncbi:hypothetical protein RvY_08399 [Ramazzottius varieornatus]|uniref:Uncharacterized protein n=1 Tax=Ramazzottius varieornatus TaxID=947166 RepID=A0A1D1V5N3_RAMVA|nr:hypothetical protein RvY_08399 [Ramazzottius varieornatus]